MIPMFVSDYVLMGYGTGVDHGAFPATTTRDWEFAKKFGLPIIEVVAGGDVAEGGVRTRLMQQRRHGKLRLPRRTDRRGSIPAMKKLCWLEQRNRQGRRSTSSCATGYSPVSATGASRSPLLIAKNAAGCRCPRSELPLVLPEVDSYEPTDDGESLR